MDIEPLYSIAGVLVGLLVGLTGVGGGSLMTPILVLAFGFHPATAVGTDLLYASATKLVGTGVHGWRGTVDWRVVRRLATGSVPATLLTLGGLSLAKLRAEDTGHLIAAVLGVALILTGIATLFRGTIVDRLIGTFRGFEDRRIAGLTILLGAVLGSLVTLTSVGAGALGMTALLVLYPRFPVAKLVGSDIAHAVPLTLIAGLGHWAIGSVDFGLLLSLLIGSVPGIIVGSLLASHAPDRVLTPILAVTLTIVGGKLLL
ncbi:MAG: sulfite exporter TauE/SafE family protein [Proteobacteria bacterium]|nr:sulfite exporter TauE/SafE family protein [Pseudomonadota bacterium]